MMSQRHANALPEGVRLGDYVIGDVIGVGGFGIVYRATDNLGRMVAIKEYMPDALATRSDGLTVSIRSDRYEGTFAKALDSFVNEAQTLARFNHPGIVQVYAFWRANGTAYMAMPFYSGRTLQATLRSMPVAPEEAWLRRVTGRLLDTLELLHRERIWHRDIAPDNIILVGEDQPLLLDFGAARRVIGDMTHDLTAILKPGYAPWEQYGDAPGLSQGPWTDIYALSAVLYFAISGKVPSPSVMRAHTDTMAPASEAGRNRYSAGLLAAIDAGLVLDPKARLQDVQAFREALTADDRSRTNPSPAPQATAHNRTVDGGARPSKPLRVPPGTWLGVSVSVVLATLATVLGLTHLRAPPIPIDADTDARSQPSPIREPLGQESAGARVFAQLTAASAPAWVPEVEWVPDTSSGSSTGRLRVSVAQPGFTYVFQRTPGNDRLQLIFPSALEPDNALAPGASHFVPPTTRILVRSAGADESHILVIVTSSPAPLDQSSLRPNASTLLDETDATPLASMNTVEILRALLGQSPCLNGRPPGCIEHLAARVVNAVPVGATSR